jgi:hypothetical protein
VIDVLMRDLDLKVKIRGGQVIYLSHTDRKIIRDCGRHSGKV